MASSAARSTANIVVRTARPIVSTTPEEARRSVLKAYKAWMRYAPTCWWEHRLKHMPLGKFKFAIKQEFMKNRNLKDLRAIDRLVYKANSERFSCETYCNNYEHIMNYLFKENIEPKAADFLSKFFAGKD